MPRSSKAQRNSQSLENIPTSSISRLNMHLPEITPLAQPIAVPANIPITVEKKCVKSLSPCHPRSRVSRSPFTPKERELAASNAPAALPSHPLPISPLLRCPKHPNANFHHRPAPSASATINTVASTIKDTATTIKDVPTTAKAPDSKHTKDPEDRKLEARQNWRTNRDRALQRAKSAADRGRELEGSRRGEAGRQRGVAKAEAKARQNGPARRDLSQGVRFTDYDEIIPEDPDNDPSLVKSRAWKDDNKVRFAEVDEIIPNKPDESVVLVNARAWQDDVAAAKSLASSYRTYASSVVSSAKDTASSAVENNNCNNTVTETITQTPAATNTQAPAAAPPADEPVANPAVGSGDASLPRAQFAATAAKVAVLMAAFVWGLM
ncbi:hypothetical protein VTI74DRAFT_6681 [Chaetomium olivicolor]